MKTEPAQLPSAIHSHQFVTGQPGGAAGVVYDVIERSGLIFMGLWLARNQKDLLCKAIIASAVIEVAVIFWQANKSQS